MEKPIELGEIIEERIVDISYDGKGVLKKDNFAIFTDEGVYGDLVRVRIEKLKKNFAIGKTLELVEKSPHRIKSECEYSDLCGGCQFQEIEYSQELKLKKDEVVNDLERIGKLEGIEVFDTIGMEEPIRYRNNVQIPLIKSGGKTLIGHFEKNSHRVVDTHKCLIQEEIADKVVKIFRDFMDEEDITAYHRKQNKGLVRHLIIRTSRLTKDTMVIVVINGDNLPRLERLVAKLGELDEFKSLYININKSRGNLVTGRKYRHIYGQKQIIDSIGDLKYKISPQSFFQVNTRQAERLYEKVADFADLKGEEVLVDLYSGIGTIALFLASRAEKVIGIEIVKRAVEDARENAKLNNIDNALFFEGSAEKMLPELERVAGRADVLVVDPPRRGCEEKLLEDIVAYSPEKIIYVSCNPSTLARDLKYLEENKYRAIKAQPVDMFPRTNHIECVIGMQRKDT